MKNFIKLFGVIVLAVIIGFTITACDNSGDDNNTGGLTVGATNGRLTITGLPDGSFVFAVGYDMAHGNSGLFAATNVSNNWSITGGQVSGGTVTLNVWRESITALSNYNGTGEAQFDMVIVANKATITLAEIYAFYDWHPENISSKPSWLVDIGRVHVDSFVSGIGSGTFVEGFVTVGATDGRLTISGLPNGSYVRAWGYLPWPMAGYLFAADAIHSNWSVTAAGPVSGGTVTLKVWREFSRYVYGNYDGDDDAVRFDLLVTNKPSITRLDLSAIDDWQFGTAPRPAWLIAMGKVYASFTNGIGSGTFVSTNP
ncbi:MAG: hypothetical protein FWD87_01280 [Spirochaetaceae bacterium]|nr:hypothetical protein [Spirochaetaceae bacterium]